MDNLLILLKFLDEGNELNSSQLPRNINIYELISSFQIAKSEKLICLEVDSNNNGWKLTKKGKLLLSSLLNKN